ncbi:uncharacterized protein LOC116168956 isoform X4 [Photinus pyralis]|uniref:uncharacterized protein LOC116168956 isoform X4 n=1 Tax=Photinus pyralis TaxID=7054 RepID=UPI00126769F7|nr:uncharacterized protein LOC116168956 isoform X4 [Photinus pyralis]
MKVPWMKCLENQGTLPRQTTSGGEIPKKEKSTRWRHAWNSLRKFRLRKRRKGTTKEDDPQNGVVSQRSTLSSSCSSSPSVASLHGDIKGIGTELHQQTRNSAARNSKSRAHTAILATKAITADKKENVISDTVMGGHSRSHKKRAREYRKKCINLNVVSTDNSPNSTMETPKFTPSISEVKNKPDEDVNKNCETENELKALIDNKLLDKAQTNYRVESPETVTLNERRNSGTVVKSKSLDDDDHVKIIEVSETSECDDKISSQCNALITEANSDVEWEETIEMAPEPSEKQYGDILSSVSSQLQRKPELIQINLITPEDRTTLSDEINLVTSPADGSEQLQKKEGYKERKARKRAAIAEHFMPVLQQPRYLDVIKEESSDNSDRDSTHNGVEQKRIMRVQELPGSYTKGVVDCGGNLQRAVNVEGSWSTSLTERSISDTEFVYIDDSDEMSESEENSNNLSCDVVKCENEILPPASQLTPPPTPDNVTPQNEMMTNSALCDGSENKLQFSITEISKDDVNSPPALRELCLKILATLPFGAEILEELAQVSQGLEELTSGWQSQLSCSLQTLLKHFPSSVTPSLMLKHYNERDTNDSFTVPAARKEMPLNPYEKWVGIPTQDPKVIVCLSPTQKSHLETTSIVPNEAGKLLELHQMYLNRRGYHEENSNERDEHGKITKLSSELDAFNENLSQPRKVSNRLLAIIRESSSSDRSSNVETQPDRKRNLLNNVKCNLNSVMDATSDTKPAHKFLEYSNLRDKSASVPELSHESKNATASRTSTESRLNESRRMQSSVENIARSVDISHRRFSLPQEVYQRQLQYIREKEKEIQVEIEKLEEEKKKLLFEMTSEVPPKQFETSQYHISKKGDIAIHNDENVPLTNGAEQKASATGPTEVFRQQMYNEYMQKVADREERKLQKVIKITSSRTVQNDELIESNNNICEVTHVSGIENEFMDKVKERLQKHGLKRDDSEEFVHLSEDREDSAEPVLVIDGDSVKHSKELPKHLQEFVDITRRAAETSENDTKEGNSKSSKEARRINRVLSRNRQQISGSLLHEIDSDLILSRGFLLKQGVWSPGQKSAEEKPKEVAERQQGEDEPIPSVWQPRSAGASPTAERKEFKPVSFDSPTLRRKNQPAEKESNASEEPPPTQRQWTTPSSASEVGTSLSSILERRLPTSHSAPSTGFSELTSSRLPRAQNPTITLLQKAREGHLPRGASYIQTYSDKSRDDKHLPLGTVQVSYHTKDDSNPERQKKMADLNPARYERGIGPVAKDGMPLVLRSEVKDGNQSRWYKKMYDTIHKQKPEREYVTVRYKQRRARYPYASGYFSEPEQHSAFSAYYYDSDGTTSDNKYATLDRRRIPPSRDKENEFMSSTLPRQMDSVNLEIIRSEAEQDVHRSPPGRIENYTPGRSSISDKEAKQHLEQQKGTPLTRGHMSQALKESGYESDSTLIFRRREDALQQLSPLEQREAYKVIQKGGDVPLQGLRKPAPERPKEVQEIQYLPISPSDKRMRTTKNMKPNELVCYPLSVPPHPRHIFAEYKRTAPSTASTSSCMLKPSTPSPPSPPKRRSSRNSNTMRLISRISGSCERSHSSRRHETCFAPTSELDKSKIRSPKDSITHRGTSKRFGDLDSKLAVRSVRTVSVSPLRTALHTKTCLPKGSTESGINTLSARSSSCSPTRTCYSPIIQRKPIAYKGGTFGVDKRNIDLKLPINKRSDTISESTELLSPTEVKKVVTSKEITKPSTATYKTSTAVYSSVRNGAKPTKDNVLPIQVGITQRGRELLRPSRSLATSLLNSPIPKRSIGTRTTTPSPISSLFRSHSGSNESLRKYKRESATVKAPTTSRANKNGTTKKSKVPEVLDNAKKLKKSKKDQVNGEIVKRDKKYKTKNGGKHEDKANIMVKFTPPLENVLHFTRGEIQKQRDAMESHSFFQNLFWKDISSPSAVPSPIRSSWIAEKTRLLCRTPTTLPEPTIGALRIYLNHTKPVTESKFKTLDASMVRSRSVSPKSVSWNIDQMAHKETKHRSYSLPPKIILTETRRPVSPISTRTVIMKDGGEKEKVVRTASPIKLVLTETSRPISPIVDRRRRRESPTKPHYTFEKIVLTETTRPVSPIVARKSKKVEPKPRDPPSVNKLIFSETSRPISPVLRKKAPNIIPDYGIKKTSSTPKIVLSQTSRPISPVVEKKYKCLTRESDNEDLEKTPVKLFFTESSRPVSPKIDRKVIVPPPPLPCRERSVSPTKIVLTETSRPISPMVDKRHLSPKSVSRDSGSVQFYDSSRTTSPHTERRYAYSPSRVYYPDSVISSSFESRSRERSVSPPAKLYFSETSRPVSPQVARRSYEEMHMQMKTKKVPSREEELLFFEDNASIASSGLHSECRSFPSDVFHSPQRCNRFKELNKFYSTLERMGELERTTSSSELRPRGRREEEIIDYERWKEVHARERAEKELQTVYNKLRQDQKEKGFLFRPKDVKLFRWKQEADRGLRVKDKSVEAIKTNFEKLASSPSTGAGVPDQLIFHRDLYKPLWRGSSVVDLASSMVERRSQSEGRISTIKKKLSESERLLTHGIGSRIWSSLSSEQINLLKGQLSEIYNQNSQQRFHVPAIEYAVNVPVNQQKSYKPFLRVRRNSSDSAKKFRSESQPPNSVLTENEKKRLSQSLGIEVMNRVSQRQDSRASPSLVKGKETRGAIAAADAKIIASTSEPFSEDSLENLNQEKQNSNVNSIVCKKTGKMSSDEDQIVEKLPKPALVSTDVTNRVTSVSETESGSTDESTKTVIYLGNKDVQKKVEYFEQVAEERPYTPTIYRAAESQNNDDELPTDTQQHSEIDHIEEVRPSCKLVASQSYQDLKELFGEQEQSKYCGLSARPLSTEEVKIGNKENGAVTNIEVRNLKNKFEFMDDFSSNRLTASFPRRTRSNPELYRKQIVIPGQIMGEVDTLRRKYEYPWIFSRGRSRVRRGGVVSPMYFRAEDRYMPHINIISKIASLYPKKTVFLSDVRHKSTEELTKLLGCPVGEVERLRKKFDSPDRNISILGHMFTSSPNMQELRDIAPYLTGSWTAHRYPRKEDNTRSLSSPDNLNSSWDTSSVKKVSTRPKSTSPPRTIGKKVPSPILKVRRPVITENGFKREKVDPKMYNPVGRYQPCTTRIEPVRYKTAWPHAVKPSVTFKELPPPTPPPKGHHGLDFFGTESPRRYVENDVTIHYKTPVRQEVKEPISEEELSRRQAEHMKRVYEEERRRKYLQVSDFDDELQDMNNRRHTDNFIPSQKSPIPLNRYDDFLAEDSPKIKPRPRSPEHRLVARALYNFVGQSAREITFRKGDIIYIRRQVDKNWYEGEHNAMVGLFPANYVEIIPFDGVKSTPRRNHEGQARAKFNFIAQTHLELSLAKGELVVITRRVDDNWFEGRIGGRKGIFPVSYVEVLIDAASPPPPTPLSSKPVASPAAHSLLLNGSAGGKESMGSHKYTPSMPYQQHFTSSYRAKPLQIASTSYGSSSKSSGKNPINEVLHIDTHSEPVPYRALYKYRPQNDDELELLEGDVVFVLEKCDDGWYVGSSQRTGAFGTFPGNYVERI